MTFGGTPASFTSNSPTLIFATSPAGAGIQDVTVTNATGPSVSSPADKFTYGVPVPTVTAVSPNSGPAAGGTIVAITGTSFTGATNVTFGGTPASFTSNSPTLIFATSPAGAGIQDVTVTNATGPSVSSPADKFTYGAPVPTVTAVSPNSGPAAGGTIVAITGTTSPAPRT